MSQLPTTSTRPYFIRAIYEWCADNGFTPYLAIKVDENVQVPLEYVKNGEIVLNISFASTGDLEMENDYIRFQARFAGMARQIIVPVTHVTAIYARENGQGMVFTPPHADGAFAAATPPSGTTTQEAAKNATSSASNKAPTLHVVGDEKATQSKSSPGTHKLDDPPPMPPKDGKKSAKKGDQPQKPTLRIVD